jgi:hypothetical protein
MLTHLSKRIADRSMVLTLCAAALCSAAGCKKAQEPAAGQGGAAAPASGAAPTAGLKSRPRLGPPQGTTRMRRRGPGPAQRDPVNRVRSGRKQLSAGCIGPEAKASIRAP